ncbi:unnamed protein product [Toxocara canis]|uniref:Longin domain-containing protein n=1 Tax=Toxocara canis TaxID=6265 RepID=A0A183U6E9_TOXCA|nr:unnamed protein product [Toxocara canis]
MCFHSYGSLSLNNISNTTALVLVCLVKAGPVQKERYEYIVLAETDGTERCRIYHIYARNAEEFIKTHYDTIARFMKEVFFANIHLAALRKSSSSTV